MARAMLLGDASVWQQHCGCGMHHGCRMMLEHCIAPAPHPRAARRRGIPFVVASQARLAEDPGVAALSSYLAGEPSATGRFMPFMPHF